MPSIHADTQAQIAALRLRVQLRREADDTAVKLIDAGGVPTPADEAALQSVRSFTGLDAETALAITTYAKVMQNTHGDDEFTALFGPGLRVANFCKATGITVVDPVANKEARRYASLTAVRRFVVLWMDLSAEPVPAFRTQLVRNYLQAMRVGLARLRQSIRKSNTKRALRTFGISCHSISELPECPGLYRVVLDSRPDVAKDSMAKLLDAVTYDGMTVVTQSSIEQPSVVEQKLAVLRRTGNTEEI